MGSGNQCAVVLTPNSIDQLKAASADSVRCGPDRQHITVKWRGQVSTGIFRLVEQVIVLGATRASYAGTGYMLQARLVKIRKVDGVIYIPVRIHICGTNGQLCNSDMRAGFSWHWPSR